MELALSFQGKKLTIPRVVVCKNKLRGLMFTSREHSPLLFEFSKAGFHSIHSFFVFYSFLALWILGGEIVDWKIVRPFTAHVQPTTASQRLLEIPFHQRNQGVIEKIVGK